MSSIVFIVTNFNFMSLEFYVALLIFALTCIVFIEYIFIAIMVFFEVIEYISNRLYTIIFKNNCIEC